MIGRDRGRPAVGSGHILSARLYDRIGRRLEGPNRVRVWLPFRLRLIQGARQ